MELRSASMGGVDLRELRRLSGAARFVRGNLLDLRAAGTLLAVRA